MLYCLQSSWMAQDVSRYGLLAAEWACLTLIVCDRCRWKNWRATMHSQHIAFPWNDTLLYKHCPLKCRFRGKKSSHVLERWLSQFDFYHKLAGTCRLCMWYVLVTMPCFSLLFKTTLLLPGTVSFIWVWQSNIHLL